MKTFSLAILLSLLVNLTLATKGIDTQFEVTLDQMKCIINQTTENKDKKQYFVILRAWNGNNTFMNTIHSSLKNAKAAGVNASQIMLYVQPCGGVSAS